MVMEFQLICILLIQVTKIGLAPPFTFMSMGEPKSFNLPTLKFMADEYEQQRRKQVIGMRSVADYGMGFVFFLIGVYFLTYAKLGLNIFPRKPSPVDYLIGILFVAYGAWRMYRGYKKNYFKE